MRTTHPPRHRPRRAGAPARPAVGAGARLLLRQRRGPPARRHGLSTALLAVGRDLRRGEAAAPSPRSASCCRANWPDRDPELARLRAIRYLLADRAGAAARRLGQERTGDAGPRSRPGSASRSARTPSPDALILRYLAAFGPASVTDAQTWSWLTGLRDGRRAAAARARTFRDEAGRELFDLPDAPRPDPDTPAPLRFVPEYDNLLLSHADRTRVIADEHRERVFTKGAFLVDGFVHGTWKIARQRNAATLQLEPFRPLSKKDANAVTARGHAPAELRGAGSRKRGTCGSPPRAEARRPGTRNEQAARGWPRFVGSAPDSPSSIALFERCSTSRMRAEN